MSELFTILIRLALLQALAIGTSHWVMLRVLPAKRAVKILLDACAVLIPTVLVIGSSVGLYGWRAGFMYYATALALLGLWHEVPPFVTFLRRRKESGHPLMQIRGIYPRARWLWGGGYFSLGLLVAGGAIIYAEDSSIAELLLMFMIGLRLIYAGFTVLAQKILPARISENGFLDATRFVPWDNVEAVSWNEGAVHGQELYITIRTIPLGDRLRLSLTRQLTWKMSREERPAVAALLQQYLPEDVLTPPMPVLMREAIARVSQLPRRALTEPTE